MAGPGLARELNEFESNMWRYYRAYRNGVISVPEFNVKVREEVDRLQGAILRGFGLNSEEEA